MLCMVWSECCFECVPFGEAVSSALRDALFVLTIVKQTNPARVQLHTHHIHTHTQIYIYKHTIIPVLNRKIHTHAYIT